jgi:hypothetical protein
MNILANQIFNYVSTLVYRKSGLYQTSGLYHTRSIYIPLLWLKAPQR